MGRESGRWTAAPVGWLALAVLVSGATPAATLDLVANRAEDPVLVPGLALSDLAGTPIHELALFRWDEAEQRYRPVPYQIDERVDRLFPFGPDGPFRELVYDVFGEDDGLLDDDDELAFLFGDAGPEAPPGIPWPEGALEDRYVLRVSDPRPGSTEPDRWAYLFSGSGLERAPTPQVSWNLQAAGTIDTLDFSVGYDDRWLLTELRVNPPCGTGEDLIDRAKGRAGFIPELGENEEMWNASSFYLGGMVGPVRAIRYVRGAASGMNTVHHDVVYRCFWDRVVNLRVHPVNAVWLYIDLLPLPESSLILPSRPEGIPVDGEPDAGVGSELPAWSLVRSAAGGYAMIYDVAVSPFVQTREFYYMDDADYDDANPAFPYSDDDDSAYGNHGIRLVSVSGSGVDTIPVRFRFLPLCANEGDAGLGGDLRSLFDAPLEVQPACQSRLGVAVRSLRVERDGDDVLLEWDPVNGAEAYRVHGTYDPVVPHVSWNHLGDVTVPTFRHEGAAANPVPLFYSVVTLTASEEGPW